MPTFEFTAPDGKSYEVGAPEGATQEQAFQMLQGQIAGGEAPAATAPSTAVSAGRALNDVPRQLGLTARYGMEGIANTAQVVTEPLRYITDRLTGMTGRTKPLGALATQAADAMGLPSPQNSTERVIGDASRLVAGAGGMAGAAGSAAGAATTTGANLLRGLAANPAQQLAGAAGAGLAGGASREAGGGQWQQAGAALLGGVAGAAVPSVGASILASGRGMLGSLRPMSPEDLDIKLTSVLQQAGTDYNQLPAQVRQSLRAELASSLQAGKDLDPAAVSRLADFRTVGATPTRGMLSQNPVQITREQNLAKMAANSADGELHGLPLMQNRNNSTLIGRLNDLGGRTETAPIAAGQVVRDRIAGTYGGLQNAEQTAWDAAKAMPGYKAPISNEPLHAAMASVSDEALTGYLPKQVTDYMGAFQTGAQPFTPQHYKNLRSLLSGELAKGGNEAAAARAAIKGLDSAPMRPITNPGGIDFGTAPVTAGLASAMRQADGQPASAINAIDTARRATAAKYGYAESTPLVRTALGDARTADPEKLAQSFILNGTLNDARSVAQEVGPQGMATIRDALATHIKKQALSGSADETGKVSQSALNAALKNIGDDKLRLFFSPEEVAQFKAAGRVASLMQSQPIGSAVNNSNSGALLLGRGMDMLNGIAGKIPFGRAAIIDPLQGINLSVSQRAAQKVLPGLLAAPAARPVSNPLLLPGLAMSGGLLSAE
ncbi:hypothetical protein [Variovorax sp. PAMC 28711]|uniref:hypothetical protein n=1 Tax=Variovorax sp. PAMC 28711 TaxID=1795631 RepID=UPI00078B81AF|nr:hypothetical protein [Variovorax sp. PAMC 28711]AMM22984.1 hypothetical protein AX767_00265 [Variovorax sp. PAMC 28711]